MQPTEIKKIGLVGCGNIGTIVAEYIESSLSHAAQLTLVFDTNEQQIKIFLKKFSKNKIEVMNSYDQLIPNVDLVIEAASAKVSGDIASKAMNAGKDVVVMSVGGLLDVYKDIEQISSLPLSGTLYIPSGAIAGIDALNAMSLVKIEQVILTTKKHPQALQGAPYLEAHPINLEKINKAPCLIFEGSAKQAIKGFPQNINVAALLSLAGIGADKTIVKIMSSTEYKNNIHEIYIKGDFGEMNVLLNNKPLPHNPKTSYLAALSVCSLLYKMLNRIKIGS